MKRFLQNVALFFMLTAAQSVFAVNWVSVGDENYVDLDSKKHQGDLASIRYRGSISLGQGNGFALYHGEEVEFDCKRKVVTSWSGSQVFPNTPEAEALKKACVTWYKFWK